MSTQGRMYIVFHGRFPGEKAASVFTAKSAEAFALSGKEVVVVVPRRVGRSTETPRAYYGLGADLKVVYVPIVDLFFVPLLKKCAFLKSYLTFSISTLFYLLFNAKRSHSIYSNEALPLLLASFFFPHTFYEVHDLPTRSFLNRTLLSRVQGIIVTNRWKRDEIVRAFGISDQKLLYEPNAVDVRAFERAVSVGMRKKLAVPSGTMLIGYAGSLTTMEMEKGIGTLLSAVELLPPRFRLLLIGGSSSDVTKYQNLAKTLHIPDRVIFTGWVRHADVPAYLHACDVLVAPFPNTPHYNFYMSPLKIFEYMAAGKPFVASRLHSIEEILTDSEAFLVSPGDVAALKVGIERAVSEVSAGVKVERARHIVREHTWQKRAARIIDFMNKG